MRGGEFSDTSSFGMTGGEEIEVDLPQHQEVMRGGDELSESSIDLPENIELISVDDIKIDSELEESSIDYPEYIELSNLDNTIEDDNSINNLFIKKTKLNGGDMIEETTIDLPEDIEVISFEN